VNVTGRFSQDSSPPVGCPSGRPSALGSTFVLHCNVITLPFKRASGNCWGRRGRSMALRYRHSRSAELRAQATARVMQWVLALVSEERATTAVSITSSECGHAACGGNETIVLLTRAGGPTTKVKIARSLETVTRAEIADALSFTSGPPGDGHAQGRDAPPTNGRGVPRANRRLAHGVRRVRQ
jgi:hypothetical protein